MISSGLAPVRVLNATCFDKKSRSGRVRYALPVALGRMARGPAVTRTIEDGVVLAVLREN